MDHFAAPRGGSALPLGIGVGTLGPGRNRMRVLIAGCGYVGSALAERLVRQGHETFGLSRRPAGLPAGVTPLAADLCDRGQLGSALPAGLDAVVYAAAADGREEAAYRRAYVEGLANLLDALRGTARAPRVLFTSSTSVHGQADGEWVDEASPTMPARATARILLEGEALLAGAPGSASILRLGGIYGPGRTRLLERVRAGEARVPAGPPIFTNRIHRDDAAGALDHLLKLPSVDPVYLGVDDDPAEFGDVLRWIAERLGVPAPREADPAPGQDRRASKRCRNRRLRKTGFAPRYPSFRDGYGALLSGSEGTGVGQ